MYPILNNDLMTVSYNGKSNRLTPKEFGILEFLMQNPNKTFSPEEIYENVWEEKPFACQPIIAVHLRHVREKLEDDPSKPKLIKSLWGRGYRFVQS